VNKDSHNIDVGTLVYKVHLSKTT